MSITAFGGIMALLVLAVALWAFVGCKCYRELTDDEARDRNLMGSRGDKTE